MNALPSKERLLAACRGEIREDHLLLHWACELSQIHQQLLAAGGRGNSEIDGRRATLTLEIDRWVSRQVPVPTGGARVHTEALGAVIDRLAQFTAAAYAVLSSASGGEELLGPWERLGELAIAYQDLIDEVSSGRRRLPCMGRGH
ncbi:MULTISPECIES: DUF4254 domain-containing protein [unclassified Nocardia]|uniref:DUF4254 domain-containing protein n=1 Tax=unclassified Nocardia TaxID=2637762 RepID=UPI00278C631A|nr:MULTISPECIES: DUF4254 domain-containing protein [unclassified Nocardia]